MYDPDMNRTGVNSFIAAPVQVLTSQDPYAVALYGPRGERFVARTWSESNAVMEALARDVKTDHPEQWRVEAFFERGGAIVFAWGLSRAHQLGCEVAGGAWEAGTRSGGAAWN